MTKSKKNETKVSAKTEVIFDQGSQKSKKNKLDKSKIPSHKFLAKPPTKIKPWVKNKITEARKLSEHRASRAAKRFGGPSGVALIILLTLTPLLFPKDDFQKAKEQLAKNPADFQAHLILADKLLGNHQFEEAERVLLLAQQTKEQNGSSLDNQDKANLEELWEKKYNTNPEDIRKLIAAWKRVVQEKVDYRDGYLQLAVLHYKIYDNQKAKDYLKKTLELDPNFELARKLERVIRG